MFGLRVEIENRIDRIRKAEQDARRGSFSRTSFLIRQTAVQSITRADGPSSPGRPPHTHRGNWLRRSIRYSSDKQGAVIGTLFSVLGTAGAAHEHGGMFRGQRYDERPFMMPALEKNLDIFTGTFAGSIAE